jgi:hypothetical protein
MTELEKLLATRRDARVAVLGPADGPVLIGARSLQSIPDELRAGLDVVKAPRVPWWRVLLRV